MPKFNAQNVKLNQMRGFNPLQAANNMVDVVTAVDGEEEIIQGGLHVPLVIRFYGIVILPVCLALRQPAAGVLLLSRARLIFSVPAPSPVLP